MSGPLRLRHRVLEVVRNEHLWSPGSTVVVACSGGRDSVVLLDVLRELGTAHGGRLEVLTIDHGQRAESAADAAFVVKLARSWGIPARSVPVVPASGSEADLRSARHAVFREEVARGKVVCLGHHRRDQAETVLLQLLRGGGGRARSGMSFRRDGLVRPLLDESVRALHDWAEARGLSWREDPTNAELDRTRNRVRHQVLPLLDDLRPGAVDTLARSARLSAMDEELLEALARDVPVTGAALAAAPPPLARRALLAAWPTLSASGVDALLAAVHRGTGAVQLPGGRRVLVRRDGPLRLEGPATEGGAVGAPAVVVTDEEPAPGWPEESP